MLVGPPGSGILCGPLPAPLRFTVDAANGAGYQEKPLVLRRQTCPRSLTTSPHRLVRLRQDSGLCALLPAVEKSPSERTLGPASQGHGGSYMLRSVCGGPSPSCRESVELLHGLQESERISGEPTPWPAGRATLTRSSPAAWRWLRKGSCGRPGRLGLSPFVVSSND